MFGGYDYKPVEKVREDFYCNICMNLMKDPMQLECSHGMCNSCLQHLAKSSRERNQPLFCPSCRKEINEKKVYPASMIKRIILSVKVKCVHEERGCQWIGELGDATTHQANTCEYEEVSCSFDGCEVKIQRNGIEEHQTKCDFRNAPCEYCQNVGIYKDIPIHLRVCNMFPVICPNGCGESVPREHVPEHTESCLLAMVECSYSAVGCTVKVVRKDLNTHMQLCMQEHMLLTMNDSKTKLDKVEEELLSSKHDRDALHEKLDTSQREIASQKRVATVNVTETDVFLEFKNDLDFQFQIYCGKLEDAAIFVRERFTRKFVKEDLETLIKELNKKLNDVITKFGELGIDKEFVERLGSYRAWTQFPEPFWEVWDKDLKTEFIMNASLQYLNQLDKLKKKEKMLSHPMIYVLYACRSGGKYVNYNLSYVWAVQSSMSGCVLRKVIDLPDCSISMAMTDECDGRCILTVKSSNGSGNFELHNFRTQSSVAFSKNPSKQYVMEKKSLKEFKDEGYLFDDSFLLCKRKAAI